MNSRRYCIGFFAGIFLLSLLYIFSDLRFQSAEEGVRAEEGIVYYLEEEEGKVSIPPGFRKKSGSERAFPGKGSSSAFWKITAVNRKKSGCFP